jgi:hypothetical protein
MLYPRYEREREREREREILKILHLMSVADILPMALPHREVRHSEIGGLAQSLLIAPVFQERCLIVLEASITAMPWPLIA